MHYVFVTSSHPSAWRAFASFAETVTGSAAKMMQNQ